MAHTIFLIEGNADIEKIKLEILTHKNSKIFALNYVAHKNLDENNIPHEIAENYLTVENRKKIDDNSIHITANWHENNKLKNLLTFEGINLGSLIEMELLLYFAQIYGTAMMINKIIEKENPVYVISDTILNDYVKRLGIVKNIQVISHDLVEQPSLQFDKINIKYNLGSYPVSLTISRSTFMKIRKIFDKTVSLMFKLNPDLKFARQKSILLVEFNPAQYDILIKELSTLNKNILLLNQRRPAIWNLQSFKIIRNSKCKIININNFEKKISTKVVHEIDAIKSKLENLWNLNSVFEEVFSFNSQTFWYSIKNSFIKICNARFSESIRRILLLNELFVAFNISVIFEWAETGQEEKEIIFLSKKRGIKSILLQHAMDPSSHKWDRFNRFALGGYSWFISDNQALWGEPVKKRALSYGHKEENLLVTGSPRHDDFFKAVDKGQSKGIILFATTSVTGRISYEQTPFDAYVKFDSFVKEVCKIVKKFPDKQLIVKPHPQPDFLSNITQLIKEIDPQIPILYNANLVELINSCDVLITFNNSTVALESLILGKPVISLQIEKWAEEDEFVKTGAVLSISNIGDLEGGINNILYNDEFKNNILKNSKKFVERYLANRGTASKALTKILDSF